MPEPLTEAEGLANLRAFAVFGNANGVTRHPLEGGGFHWTGWIAGSLYASSDGRSWRAVDQVWRTG